MDHLSVQLEALRVHPPRTFSMGHLSEQLQALRGQPPVVCWRIRQEEASLAGRSRQLLYRRRWRSALLRSLRAAAPPAIMTKAQPSRPTAAVVPASAPRPAVTEPAVTPNAIPSAADNIPSALPAEDREPIPKAIRQAMDNKPADSSKKIMRSPRLVYEFLTRMVMNRAC